jgi:hypothetical protein
MYVHYYIHTYYNYREGVWVRERGEGDFYLVGCPSPRIDSENCANRKDAVINNCKLQVADLAQLAIASLELEPP